MAGTHQGAVKRSLSKQKHDGDLVKAKRIWPGVPVPHDVWDRQQNESPDAWEAFRHYRDAGLQRTVRATAIALDKSRELFTDWSTDNHWAARCAAYDAEEDRLYQMARRKQLRAAAERHVRIGVELQSTVLRRLVTMANRDGDELELRDLPRWLQIGVEVERKGLGADDDVNVHLDGEVNVPQLGPMAQLAQEVLDTVRQRRAALLSSAPAERLRMLEEYGAPPPPEIEPEDDDV